MCVCVCVCVWVCEFFLILDLIFFINNHIRYLYYFDVQQEESYFYKQFWREGVTYSQGVSHLCPFAISTSQATVQWSESYPDVHLLSYWIQFPRGATILGICVILI